MEKVSAVTRGWVVGQGPRANTRFTNFKAVAAAWTAMNPVPRPTDVSVCVNSTAREPPIASSSGAPTEHAGTIFAQPGGGKEVRIELDGGIEAMEGSTSAGSLVGKVVEAAEGVKSNVQTAGKNMVRPPGFFMIRLLTQFSQRISTKISEFRTHAEDIANACFKREAGPPNPVPCSLCGGAPKIVLYRCMNCMFPQLICVKCCLTAHLSHPLHIVEEWNMSAQFWKRLSLAELGMVINLGHNGTKCIHAAQEPRSITLMHEYGVHTVKFRFCKHTGTDGSAMQLLRAGFWPATWVRPVTAFSIETLREFSLLSTHCHATAMDFCAYLRRRADALDTEDKAVSMRSPGRIAVTHGATGHRKSVHDRAPRVLAYNTVQADGRRA